ncbi:MAG: hypothetical protein F4Y22_04690 [Gammaproteobacteria bacterium]|nr:hypothetical protein [Gammaproteobacteria bacterium]
MTRRSFLEIVTGTAAVSTASFLGLVSSTHALGQQEGTDTSDQTGGESTDSTDQTGGESTDSADQTGGEGTDNSGRNGRGLY